MPKNERNQDEAALDEELKKKKAALEHQDRLRIIQEQKEFAERVRQERISKDFQKTQRKAMENMKIVEDYHSGKGQHGSTHRSQEFGTFYSWIMNSVPEFEAIVKAICYPIHAYRKQYIGGPMTSLLGKAVDSVFYNTINSFNPKENIKLPALKYINEVDADGKLTLKLKEDIFGDLLKNENGEYDQDLADLSQRIFQGYVSEWLESLDELEENDQGYFIVQTGRPPESRVYKKSDADFDVASNTYTLRAGCQDNYLKTQDYQFLIDGLGYPEKSLSVFLQNKCHDCEVQFERTSNLKPSI